MHTKKILTIALCIFGSVCSAQTKKPAIGFLVMATGSYTQFIEPLVASTEKYVLPDYDKTFFVFTDGDLQTSRKNIVRVEQKRLGWPFDTLKRFEVYLKHKDVFKHMDYVFGIDADMLFVGDVRQEILSDLVGTRHFAYARYPRKYFPYETAKKSRARVASNEGRYYYCGGFYGGRYDRVIKMLESLVSAIDDDLSRDVIAQWHDESHLNRYFIDTTPTRILPGNYCIAEERMKECRNPKLISCYKSPTERKEMCENRTT